MGNDMRRRDLITAWAIAAGSVVAVVVSGYLGWSALNQKEEAELNQADSLAGYSLSLLSEDKDLDAVVAAIKAGKILQKHEKTDSEVISALRTNIDQSREHNRLAGHTDGVYSVSFSPDGQTLATGSIDNTIKLWDVKTGKEITKTPMQYKGLVKSVSFSPDGQILATGTSDRIKLWDVEMGEEITKTLMRDSSRRVNSVSFSPDGQILATGNQNGTVKLWDMKTEEEVKLWDIKMGEKIPKMMQHKDFILSISFSPDGKILVTGSADNTIKIWDVDKDKGTEIGTLQGHHDYVNSVSFSPDGQTLATGSSDSTIKLWKNLGTSGEIATLPHGGEVESVSFSPGGQTLVSSSSDKIIKLWNVDLNLGSLIERDCDWVRNYLRNNPDLPESSLCDDVPSSALAKTEDAAEPAKEGKTKESIAFFKQTQQLQPGIDLDPEIEAIEKESWQ